MTGTPTNRPDFDAITEADLRAAGSVKWSMFPDTIGAWVAEMDFGLAPAISDAIKSAVDRGVTGYLPAQLATDLSEAASAWYAATW